MLAARERRLRALLAAFAPATREDLRALETVVGFLEARFGP